MRVMVKYARQGGGAYLSHLDMQRAFQRILRRSGLPVAYSQGFNPHIIMSFASPLSVGYETQGDYMEFRLDRDMTAEEIKSALSSVMPPSISVCFVGIIADDTKKLMSLNSSALYELQFESDKKQKFDEFMSLDSCMTSDRKGRQTDARSFVINGECDKNILTVHLKNSSEQCLNPAVIASLFAQSGEKVFIKRIECLAKTESGEVPFETLALKSN